MKQARSRLVDAGSSLPRDALAGLNGTPKALPSTLDATYPTRTELGILRDHFLEIADALDPHAALIELGSGSSLKTRLLLDARPDLTVSTSRRRPLRKRPHGSR